MTIPPFRVLVVDDNPAAVTTVRDRLGEVEDRGLAQFAIDTFDDFADATLALRNGRYDFAVVDLRYDQDGGAPQNDAGLDLFADISSMMFCPVIFYTAYGEDVGADLRELPFVWVVSKVDPTNIDIVVAELLDSGILMTIRELTREVEGEVREYLWSQQSLARLLTIGDQVKPVLFRRVASKLDCTEGQERAAGVPASRMYLYPPVTETLTCGDVLRRGDHWEVLLTPACDLVERSGGAPNGEYLRLVRALTAESVDMGRTAEAEWLKRVHTGGKPRYSFLPAFIEIPRLIVDLQQASTPLRTQVIADLERGSVERVATLDTPYAEELLVRSSQYLGRVGSPDLANNNFG
ncbi:hypothetical protein HN031_07415 [Nocardioides sp. zg-1308]|uniref:hypothetical protein n=1 Tax=Nocardioides sp. zg-1308 TaxID=2736253 RepID=UPI0015580440|nr:hypothetical protein [Nocardioides sp. zg-1308]NPD04511.1 hypothetical protein [Nocardioides sp. zg-1308]